MFNTHTRTRPNYVDTSHVKCLQSIPIYTNYTSIHVIVNSCVASQDETFYIDIFLANAMHMHVYRYTKLQALQQSRLQLIVKSATGELNLLQLIKFRNSNIPENFKTVKSCNTM